MRPAFPYCRPSLLPQSAERVDGLDIIYSGRGPQSLILDVIVIAIVSLRLIAYAYETSSSGVTCPPCKEAWPVTKKDVGGRLFYCHLPTPTFSPGTRFTGRVVERDQGAPRNYPRPFIGLQLP